MLTRVDLLKEIAEVNRDLQAFKQAYDIINRRADERQELDRESGSELPFAEWPGTKASMNVLIMCIVRCEGLLEDYRSHLERLPHGLALEKESK